MRVVLNNPRAYRQVTFIEAARYHCSFPVLPIFLSLSRFALSQLVIAALFAQFCSTYCVYSFILPPFLEG